jgi:hypothetical protein
MHTATVQLTRENDGTCAVLCYAHEGFVVRGDWLHTAEQELRTELVKRGSDPDVSIVPINKHDKQPYLWVVCKFIDETPNGNVFDIIAITDTQAAAEDACRVPGDSPDGAPHYRADYYIGPVELNRSMPDESVEWPFAYYPAEVYAARTQEEQE